MRVGSGYEGASNGAGLTLPLFVSRSWRAVGMALVGALTAALLGIVIARVGLVIGAACVIAVGLALFVAQRSVNGLVAGMATVLLLPVWYDRGGVTVMQLAVALALVGIVSATALQRARLSWISVDFVIVGLVLAAGIDWWLRGDNFAAGRATANTVLPLTFYFAARLTQRRAVRVVLWALVIAAALSTFSLFYEFVRGSSVFVDPSSYYWRATSGQAIFRPGGVFGSPPAAVTVLGMLGLVGIALWHETSGRRRSIVSGCIGLIVIAGAITFTRAGWIGFGAGLLAYLVILRWKGNLRLPRALALVPVAAVAVLLALPTVSQTRWFQQGVTRGGTLTVRESYWNLARRMISDSPQHLLFGRGINSMVVGARPELGGLQADIAESPDLISAGTHNQYVRTLMEQGLVGLSLIALWLGGTLVLALRGIGRVAAADRSLVAGLAAATISFLVVSFIDNTIRDPNSLAVIACLTGLLVSFCNPTGRKT